MQHSEQFTGIAAALAAAAGEFAPIKRDRTVTVRTKPKGDRPAGEYTFKYAPLDSILAAVRPALSKNGMVLVQSVVQEAIQQGEAIVREEMLETRLLHSSGEWFSNTCPVLIAEGENSAQAYGSAITYARRYGITQLLCVVADEDEDGNAASGNVIQSTKDGSGGRGKGGGAVASDAQLRLIRGKLAGVKGDEVALCLFLEVEALEAMPKAKVDVALAAIEEKNPAILQGAVGKGAASAPSTGPLTPAQLAAKKKEHARAVKDNKESFDFIVKTLDSMREKRQQAKDALVDNEEHPADANEAAELQAEADQLQLDIAQEWASFDDATMRALWLAPDKGGSLTTEDRADIRDASSAYAAKQRAAAETTTEEDELP